MEHFSDSRFMRLLHRPTMTVNLLEIETAFEDFTQLVYGYCLSGSDRTQLFFSLQRSRSILIALQKIQQQEKGEKSLLFNAYISSGISFIEAAIAWIKEIVGNMTLAKPVLSNGRIPIWTGNKIDLAEFIYGADSLKHFSHGEITLKEVADYFGKMLNIDLKNVSGYYTDMRERTSECRTTYLEKMKRSLLIRMEQDDEKFIQQRK